MRSLILIVIAAAFSSSLVLASPRFLLAAGSPAPTTTGITNYLRAFTAPDWSARESKPVGGASRKGGEEGGKGAHVFGGKAGTIGTTKGEGQEESDGDKSDTKWAKA